MQDLVAEYQQYQDATYVLHFFCTSRYVLTVNYLTSVEEEEAEYEEEVPVDEEQ